MEKFNLVFIDDNMRDLDLDPFVRTIADLNTDAEVAVFTNPEEGLSYILGRLNTRMIVFLDCKLDGYKLQGIDVLSSIREKTSLLYIVMMSANNLAQMQTSSIIQMINEEYICFFDRNNNLPEDACRVIEKIKQLWNVRFDCVLENWLARHGEDAQKVVLKKDGRGYTWNDILQELRNQTKLGKSFEELVNQYYIYQFSKQN